MSPDKESLNFKECYKLKDPKNRQFWMKLEHLERDKEVKVMYVNLNLAIVASKSQALEVLFNRVKQSVNTKT